MDAFVKLENITKIYHMGEVEIRAVDGIDFSIEKGEFVVIETERTKMDGCICEIRKYYKDLSYGRSGDPGS